MLRKAAMITSKGQVTMPHEVLKALGVRAGDKLIFEQDEDGIRVFAARTESRFEKYCGVGTPGIPRGKKAVVHSVRRLRGR